MGYQNKNTDPTPDKRLKDLDWAHAFYRNNPTPLRGRLAYGTFVSINNQYLYVETPKNACTKTKALLWELERLPRQFGGPEACHKRQRYDGRPSLLDLGYDGARHVLNNPTFFKFCFFRDPVARLISGYRDKIRWDTLDESAEVVAAILEQFDLKQREDIGFSHFASFICSQDDNKRNHHYVSQWSLNMADHIKYDFVGRVENYDHAMGYILRKFGAPDDLIASIGNRVHVSAGPEVDVEPEIAELIKETFAQDYRLLDFND